MYESGPTRCGTCNRYPRPAGAPGARGSSMGRSMACAPNAGRHSTINQTDRRTRVLIMTLVELSVEYRASAAALQERIGQLEQREQHEDDTDNQLLLADRIRILRNILRETRELAVLCEHYYERGYRRNAKYTL